MSHSTIEIIRNDYNRSLSGYKLKIYIDGQYIGETSRRGKKSFPIRPGEHTIYVEYTPRSRSDVITFYSEPGDITLFQSGSKTMGNFLKNCFMPLKLYLENCSATIEKRIKRDDENAIKEKLQQIDLQEKDIKDIQKSIIQEGNVTELKSVVTKLDQACTFLQYQRNIFEVKLWAIAQNDWLKRLKFITTSWGKILTQEACDETLQQLKSISNEGQALLQSWKKRTDLSITTQGKKYIQNLNDALTSCNDLLTQLLAKKAHFAVKNIFVEDMITTNQDQEYLNQLYQIMAVAEVENEELNKIEQDIQAKLFELEAGKEVQEMFQ